MLTELVVVVEDVEFLVSKYVFKVNNKDIETPSRDIVSVFIVSLENAFSHLTTFTIF